MAQITRTRDLSKLTAEEIDQLNDELHFACGCPTCLPEEYDAEDLARKAGERQERAA